MNLNLYGIEKHLKGMKGYLKRLDVNLKGCVHLKWIAEDLKFLGEHLKKMEDQSQESYRLSLQASSSFRHQVGTRHP